MPGKIASACWRGALKLFSQNMTLRLPVLWRIWSGFGKHPLRAFQPVTLAFQLAVRAVGAGEGTAALGEDGRGDFSPGIRLPIQKIISGKGLVVQILNRAGRNSMKAAILSEHAARYRVDISTLRQPFQEQRKGFFPFAADAVIQIQILQPITGIIVEAGPSQDDPGRRDSGGRYR